MDVIRLPDPVGSVTEPGRYRGETGRTEVGIFFSSLYETTPEGPPELAQPGHKLTALNRPSRLELAEQAGSKETQFCLMRLKKKLKQNKEPIKHIGQRPRP